MEIEITADAASMTHGSDRIATAAQWLSEHWSDSGQPHLRVLRQSFGLSLPDAIKAKVMAKRIIDGAR